MSTLLQSPPTSEPSTSSPAPPHPHNPVKTTPAGGNSNNNRKDAGTPPPPPPPTTASVSGVAAVAVSVSTSVSAAQVKQTKFIVREDLPVYSVPKVNLLRLNFKFKNLGILQWLGVVLAVVCGILVSLVLPLNFLPISFRLASGLVVAMLLLTALFAPVFSNMTLLQWLIMRQRFLASRIGKRTRSRLSRSISTTTTTDPNKSKKLKLPYTDEILPFFGVDNGCFSLRSGSGASGAACLIELEGLNYLDENGTTLHNFVNNLANATQVVALSGGTPNDGVAVRLCVHQHRLDTSQIVASQNEAAKNTSEPGLAIVARWDAQHFRSMEAQSTGTASGLAHRQYYVAVVLTEKAYKVEQQQAIIEQEMEQILKLREDYDRAGEDEDDEEAARMESEMYARARGSFLDVLKATFAESVESFKSDFLGRDGSGIDEMGSGAIGGSSSSSNKFPFGNRSRTSGNGNGGVRAKSEAATDSSATLQAEPETEAGGEAYFGGRFVPAGAAIRNHPVPPALAATLRRKAEVIMGSLSQYGLNPRLLDNHEAARVAASMLGMPAGEDVFPDPSPTAVATRKAAARQQREQEQLQAQQREKEQKQKQKAKAQPQPGLGLSAADQAYLAERLDRLAAFAPTTTPATASNSSSGSGSRSGIWNLEAIDAENNDGRVEPVDATAFGLARLEIDRHYVKCGSVSRYGARLPTYFGAIYIQDWPRGIRLGQLISLLGQPDLDFIMTVHITPVPPRKAMRKLERQQNQQDNLEDLVGSVGATKSKRELRDQYQQRLDLERMQDHLAGGDTSLMRVTLRIAVKSHSPILLKTGIRVVLSKLSAAGFTAYEAQYNQYFGLLSALPFGRDAIATTAGYGPRTVRLVTPEAATCLFPALVPEEASPNGIILGTNSAGSLTRFSSKDAVSKHMCVFGMSGSGKSVGTQGYIIRSLNADPKTKACMVDIQDITYEPVLALGGEAVKVGSDGQFCINMLDRSAMGLPSQITDLSETLKNFLILMRQAALSVMESTKLQFSLVRLYKQFEMGEPLTDLIVRGLYNRYHELADLKESDRYNQLFDYLRASYADFQERYQIPDTGYIVSPVHDPETERLYVYDAISKRFLGDYDTPDFEARYANNTKIGVRLRVWLTTTDGMGRNMYGGSGYNLVEIPFAAYQGIVREVAKKNFSEPQHLATVAYFLLCYLSEPDKPRRQAILEEGVRRKWEFPVRTLKRAEVLNMTTAGADAAAADKPHNHNDEANEVQGQEQGKDKDKDKDKEAEVAQVAAEIANLPLLGATLSPKGGAFFYAQPLWWQAIEARFKRELRAFQFRFTTTNGNGYEYEGSEDFWQNIDDHNMALIERDCLIGLKRGVPILSDLVGILYHQQLCIPLAETIEPYVDRILYGPMFDGYTNFDMRNRLSSFCLKNATGDLLGLRIMQCIEIIWKKIVNQPAGETTILFWDEYGSLVMLRPELADYVQMQFKRARAFGAVLILAEQSYSIVKTPAGSKAIDNCGTIQLLLQSNQAAEMAGADLGLTRNEVAFLKEATVGKALFVMKQNGRNHKFTAQHDLPPLLIKILSTKPEDRAKREQEREERSGMLSKVNEIVKLVKRYGGRSYSDAA